MTVTGTLLSVIVILPLLPAAAGRVEVSHETAVVPAGSHQPKAYYDALKALSHLVWLLYLLG